MNPPSLLAHSRTLPLAAGVLVACAVWVLLQTFVWLEKDRHHQAERAVLQAEAATVRSRLESELNATLSLSLSLSTFVLVKPDFSQADLAQVAASLVRLQPEIRSVALAPDNVIRYIYPQASNQKALGLRYLDTPSQRDAVLRLMREQRPVTAGPIELAQGGIHAGLPALAGGLESVQQVSVQANRGERLGFFGLRSTAWALHGYQCGIGFGRDHHMQPFTNPLAIEPARLRNSASPRSYSEMPNWMRIARSIAFMASRSSLPSNPFRRALSAVMIWSAMALLSLPATETTASLG